MDGLTPEEIERIKCYLICKERGHTSSDVVLSSNPPQQVCKFCDTAYWYTTPELMEGWRKPSDAHIEFVKNMEG